MAPSRIFPGWNEINQFKTPLTEGEYTLAKFLDDTLPSEWEIYVRPYVNGDRPDVVILNPSGGLQIFEVKEWGAGIYETRKKTLPDGRQAWQYYVNTTTGPVDTGSPETQVEHYRNNLINIYIPQIGEAINAQKNLFALFKVAIYFHGMNSAQVRRLGHSKYTIVLGRDSLIPERLWEIVPGTKSYSRISDVSFDPDWAKYIRYWMHPPFHEAEKIKPIRLDKAQKPYAAPNPKKHQRLRGVAGGGKTLIVAQRAANLAAEGKRVLIVTFNSTLWHYIHEQVERTDIGFDPTLIEYRHFHGFCLDYIIENGQCWPDSTDDETPAQTEERLTKRVPLLVLKSISKGRNMRHRLYDAILIDEGQDYDPIWYEVLCKFLSENDEILLVADKKQNVYRRDLSWTEKTMTGFVGRWGEVKYCYRIPLTILNHANRFADTFLDVDDMKPLPTPQGHNLDLFSHFVWKNLPAKNAIGDTNPPIEDFQAKQAVLGAIRWLTQEKGIHPSDIVILLQNRKNGNDFVDFIKRNTKFEVDHAFGFGADAKSGFWLSDDGRIKMSTIHSFKGWEINNVIVLLLPGDRPNHNLLYVAMTRSRENLIVINQSAIYAEFGKEISEDWDGQDMWASSHLPARTLVF